MIIFPPRISIEEKTCYLKADFSINDSIQTLWYSFPIEYKDYLVTENCDAFVIGLLHHALRLGEDIHIDGRMSSRLFYTLNNYLIPAFVLSDSRNKSLKVTAETLNDENLNIKGSCGTGISCGVDSLATLATHTNVDSSYNVTHLVYLNAGSHGDFGGKIAQQTFEKRRKNITDFSRKIDLPLLKIDSNISEILKLNFQLTHTLRQVSCILTLQKLFKSYYYSAAKRFDFFEMNEIVGSWDTLILSMVGTESMRFYPSTSRYNRIEKTKLVADFKLSHQHLDICTDAMATNAEINCSKCEKCMRTQLTLDLLGNLELYESVFNLDTYFKRKKAFIISVINNTKTDPFNREIYSLLVKNGHSKNKYIFASAFFQFKSKFKKIKKGLKKIIGRP